jgi:DHA2 family methylenomycin A resistance protein-like MFS transporter
MLIAARAVQGVGAAAMLPNSLALLNRAYGHEPKRRARPVGLWTAAGAISIAAGPVAGGLLIAAFGWRSIFLVNLPICAAGLLATWFWVPRDEAASNLPARNEIGRAGSGRTPGIPGSKAVASVLAAHTSRAESGPPRQAAITARAAPPGSASTRGIDLGGQCLAIVALTAFVAAVIEWRPLGLSHPLVAGGFALALLAASAFIAVELRIASPMLPLSLFSKRTFSAAVLFGICVNLTYYGMVFVLSLYLQRVRGYSPLQAGLAFLPLTGGFLVSNLVSGWAVGRFGVRVPMIAGAVVAALGYGLLHRVDAATPLIGLLLPFLLIPSGMGLAVPAMTTAVLASTDAKRAGTASAVLNTARQAGGAVGVAAFGALAGGSAAQIVSGMQTATAISAGLLLLGVGLGCLVRPQPQALAEGSSSRTTAGKVVRAGMKSR